MPADGFYDHTGSPGDFAFGGVRKVWDGLTTFSHWYNLEYGKVAWIGGGLTIRLKSDWTAPSLLQKKSNS